MYFRTDTYIEGVSATDIFTLSAALGAAIETQLVATLNRIRAVWDPDEKYLLYSFTRQPQTFPDVLLQRADGADRILMGIELKGWYLLSKEREPSFRYQVTPAACALQDLAVIVPWALDNVLSGKPKIFTPYMDSALYAAEYRNYHWQTVRSTDSDNSIIHPTSVQPYPPRGTAISDRPASDQGGNFGRFSRTGIMDSYLEHIKKEQLCGINAEHWVSFLKIFEEGATENQIRARIERLRASVEAPPANDQLDALNRIFSGFLDLLK